MDFWWSCQVTIIVILKYIISFENNEKSDIDEPDNDFGDHMDGYRDPSLDGVEIKSLYIVAATTDDTIQFKQHSDELYTTRSDLGGHLYEYKDPSWDGVVIKKLTSTPADGAGVITTSKQFAGYPISMKAHRTMKNYNIGYLSAFILTACEIAANKKALRYFGRKDRTKLPERCPAELDSSYDLFVEVGRKIWIVRELKPYIGKATEAIFIKFMTDLVDLPAEKIDTLVDGLIDMFRNHSLFEPDVKEIVEELDSWYTKQEGEELLDMLIILENYPSKHYDGGVEHDEKTRENILAIKVAIETFDIAFKPFHRLKVSAPANITNLSELIENAVMERWIIPENGKP